MKIRCIKSDINAFIMDDIYELNERNCTIHDGGSAPWYLAKTDYGYHLLGYEDLIQFKAVEND
jgi:hypothetical protein